MRRGFTLIEVIVALAIAGAVVAGAYGVLMRVVASRDSVARERERVLPAVAARQALAAWLAGAAHVDGAGPFRGLDRRDGPLPADELAFVVGDGGALHPGPRRVRLWVERSALAPRRGLLAEIGRVGGGGTDTLEVAPGAAGLEVRYRTRIEGVERWVDGWTYAAVLPEAVELRLFPAPERAADPRGDGLPGPLRLPVKATLHTDSNDEARDDGTGTTGVRADCGAVGAGAGVCAGG